MRVLRPVAFDGYIEEGGSTRPWKVLLNEGGELIPYVVKLFTPSNVIQQHPVAKEVFGNLLARDFDLPVPDMCLVDFDQSFLDTLPEHARATLNTKDAGLKFASRLESRMAIVSPVLCGKYLKDYHIANVFAFDCLCYNLDRGGHRNKPNLLVGEDDFMLIDHEQIFPFANQGVGFFNQIIDAFNNEQLKYDYTRHLLYPQLTQLSQKEKNHAFDEFTEYFQRWNPDGIRLAIKDLIDKDVSVGQANLIIDYLCTLQKSAHKFCDILISCI